MKNYNRLIGISVIVYLLLAVGAGYGFHTITIEHGSLYKLEINRIYNSLSGGTSLDKLDLCSYEFVKQVSYLPLEEMGQKEKTDAFFSEKNRMRMELKPLFGAQKLCGILRFDYVEAEVWIQPVLVYLESMLAVMEVFLLVILLYLKYRVLKPFHQMCELPYELAHGHLKGIIKEEKNQFFSRFIWGIGQLKDSLDTVKKRQLELEKEKKTMLLSLSHDIKTPLNTIKLYGKALEENIYGDEKMKRQAAHQIGEKASEIEHYVEQIMKNAREDILDIQVRTGDFYLKDLMEKVLATYAEKCRVRMVDLMIASYENRLLKGDLERAVEVFENLFENAFKYGDGRSIRITFYEEDYCQLIRIYNTGDLVTDNEFNHIFESFFRAANSDGIQGNGLGLYICREIMRKMGGEIFAQKDEKGMAFVLVFR